MRIKPAATAGIAAAALCAVALAAWSHDAPGDGTSGPVIRASEPWNGYPTAEVRGALLMRDDCLMIGDEVVFWRYGTGWDQDAQAVTFDEEPPAIVGRFFSGGGGYYDSRADFADLLGDEGVDALRACTRRTGASGVVFANP